MTGCARAHILRPVPTPAAAIQPPLTIPPLKEVPIGEELEYQISWWGIPVARAVLSASPATGSRNPRLVQFTLRASSNRYLDGFYPVRVQLISVVDPQARSPRQFEAYVKRRWRVHESLVTFDPSKKIAFHRLPKGKTATVPIEPQTQDGLSMIYHVRALPFRVGQEIPLEITADGKNWQLTGRILRVSRLELKNLGIWSAVEGQAELAYPVPFFHGARARVWFSADERRVPLLAKISSRIGPVTVVLIRRGSAQGLSLLLSPGPAFALREPQPTQTGLEASRAYAEMA